MPTGLWEQCQRLGGLRVYFREEGSAQGKGLRAYYSHRPSDSVYTQRGAEPLGHHSLRTDKGAKIEPIGVRNGHRSFSAARPPGEDRYVACMLQNGPNISCSHSELQSLLRTIIEWPVDIYDIAAVIVAVKAEVDRTPSSPILMECIAEL